MAKEEYSLSDLTRQMTEGLKKASYTKSILNYEPHEKQELFHRSNEVGRLYIGGNRGGKTVGGATEAIWWITHKHPYLKVPDIPIRGRSVSVDFVNGVEAVVKPEIKQWLPPSELINGSWEDSYNSNTRTLTLNNGSFLEFKSYDQDLDKHAGTSRHFVWFDEEPPHSIFDENMLRLLDVGGKWWMTMTPVEGATWTLDEIYEPAMEGTRDVFVIQVRTNENPHVKEENVGIYTQFLSDEDRKARVEGKFTPSAGLVFPMYDKIIHGFDTLPFSLSDSRIRIMASLDLGINDPTAWLYHAVTPDGEVWTFHEISANDLTIPQWSRIILKWERENGIKPKNRIADPSIVQRAMQTGLSNQIAYAQNGVYIGLAKTNDYSELDKMRDYLNERRWHISNKCVKLHKNMRKYRWAEWDTRKMRDKNNPKNKPHKKDDHEIDSCRYFFTYMPELSLAKELDTRTGRVRDAVTTMLDAKRPVPVENMKEYHFYPRPAKTPEWTRVAWTEETGEF